MWKAWMAPWFVISFQSCGAGIWFDLFLAWPNKSFVKMQEKYKDVR